MELGYCFECNEISYALPQKKGVYESANLSSNHAGHRQHRFGAPNTYSPPIRNVIAKLQAHAPISHNEIVLFKLAISLGELEDKDER